MDNIKNTKSKQNRLIKILSFLSSITKKSQNQKQELTVRNKTRISKLLFESFNENGGEVAARERAANIGQSYFELNLEGRKEILLLILGYKHNNELILKNIHNLLLNLNDKQEIKEEHIYELKESLRSPRKKILQNFNYLEEGISLLIEMREDLLKFIDDGNKELIPLEKDFSYLLNSWFDIGFLQLERITWESSASLLEKVILYEAVHKIKSWTDLQNRLSSDRRFYAFFHPRIPDIPLIFVEIALMNKIADSVQEILSENRSTENIEKADTAIFYSISNTQNGLRGISFGNFLIKRVVKELKLEFPNLKNFVTLSPIPKFNHWLKEQFKNNNLTTILTHLNIQEIKPSILDDLRAISNNPLSMQTTFEVGYLNKTIKPIIEKLGAYYLINKDGNWTNDPVLKFHLNNGATLHRINWLGDTSDNGLKQSLGLMVNYWYDLKKVEENHEIFATNQKSVSSQVEKLLKSKL